jgi:hypothetical protein
VFDPEPSLPRLAHPGPSRLLTNLPHVCCRLPCIWERTEDAPGVFTYRHLSGFHRDRLTLRLSDYPEDLVGLLLTWVTELHRRAETDRGTATRP